ncbi:MAG TPA: hypothetical protein VG890_08300 [Puia sp.]|nr:hypothetical protein [Puia sp.]
MAFTISHSHSTTAFSQKESVKKPSVIARFFAWAEREEETNHVKWVGISVTAMAAAIFPLAMAVILSNGALFGLIIVAMIPLVLVVITNLAAMPVKYTVPCLLIGTLIEVAAVACSFFIK